jgi:hypothetical protein
MLGMAEFGRHEVGSYSWQRERTRERLRVLRKDGRVVPLRKIKKGAHRCN